MAKMESWKGREGIVYSTLKDFAYQHAGEEEPTKAPLKQDLRVWLDKKSRAGKKVTLIKGFKGNPEHLKSLATLMKSRCGVGGAVKDGEILIQGDFRDKVVEILQQQGYKAKIAGG